jgi:hypothetical protein
VVLISSSVTHQTEGVKKVFGALASVQVEHVPDIQAWAMTIEPAGGVPQPTGAMVLKGRAGVAAKRKTRAPRQRGRGGRDAGGTADGGTSWSRTPFWMRLRGNRKRISRGTSAASRRANPQSSTPWSDATCGTTTSAGRARACADAPQPAVRGSAPAPISQLLIAQFQYRYSTVEPGQRYLLTSCCCILTDTNRG